MSRPSLLILIIIFSLFYLFIINSLKNDKISKDLLFFLLVNILLVFSLNIFYFYFQNEVFSFIISFLLLINNILMFKEIKYIHSKYYLITIPYFIYIIYIVIFMLIKLF